MGQPDEGVVGRDERVATCPDPWHKGRFAARYICYTTYDGGRWWGTSYQCRTCGFRTCQLLDEEDNDVTDRYIVRQWEPGLASRVAESARDRFRFWVGKVPRRCSECGVRGRSFAAGRKGRLCRDCREKLFEKLFGQE